MLIRWLWHYSLRKVIHTQIINGEHDISVKSFAPPLICVHCVRWSDGLTHCCMNSPKVNGIRYLLLVLSFFSFIKLNQRYRFSCWMHNDSLWIVFSTKARSFVARGRNLILSVRAVCPGDVPQGFFECSCDTFGKIVFCLLLATEIGLFVDCSASVK